MAVEVVDIDGERGLRTLMSRDLRTWEVRGMLDSMMSDCYAADVIFAQRKREET